MLADSVAWSPIYRNSFFPPPQLIGGSKNGQFVSKNPESGEVSTWAWLGPKEAMRKNKALKLSGLKASADTSGLVSANLKIDEEQLTTLLKSHGVSTAGFGQDGARSLHEFAQEIARGEAHLQEIPIPAKEGGADSETR